MVAYSNSSLQGLSSCLVQCIVYVKQFILTSLRTCFFRYKSLLLMILQFICNLHQGINLKSTHVEILHVSPLFSNICNATYLHNLTRQSDTSTTLYHHIRPQASKVTHDSHQSPWNCTKPCCMPEIHTVHL